ncbi:tautomerase family protein [bacterium]|nr:tautomerase family protein [bacterium]
MPNIYIEGPPIKDLDKKRKLVAAITDAAAEAFGLPKEAIIVTIRENLPENVAIGGRLIIDRGR